MVMGTREREKRHSYSQCQKTTSSRDVLAERGDGKRERLTALVNAVAAQARTLSLLRTSKVSRELEMPRNEIL